ncbi:MAG: ABC transporter ATP-binding protein [Pseudomonadota bacterium]
MSNPLVICEDIQKTYGDFVALDTLNMQIEAGQFVVLLGPSGSGKTTLLSILGGFTTPTTGKVFIDGVDVTNLRPAERPTVTVFQDYALFPHMTVAQNIAFGLTMRNVPKLTLQDMVQNALHTIDLQDLGGRRIHELSGGQRQRVALARAIVVEPSLLLLDEPLGALDLKIRQQMQDELVALQRKCKTTFVHVTHDQEEAMNIADVVVVINQGKIEDMGPPERVYLHPSSVFSANFMGESNILPCSSVGTNGVQTLVRSDFGELLVTGELRVGDTAHISIRPEHLRVGHTAQNDQKICDAKLVSMRFQGAYRRAVAQIDGTSTRLHLRIKPEQEITASETAQIYANPEDFVLLQR